MQPGKDLKFELVHRFNEGDEQGFYMRLCLHTKNKLNWTMCFGGLDFAVPLGRRIRIRSWRHNTQARHSVTQTSSPTDSGRLRTEDCMNPGVQDHPGQCSQTLLKVQGWEGDSR